MSNQVSSRHSAADAAPDEKITAGDLDFYNLLRRSSNDGKLFFNRRRAVLFDTDSIGALRQQLVSTLGPELAMGVLFRFGYAQGYQDAEMLGDTFDWATETDWLAAGPAIHTLEGVVHVEAKAIEFDRDSGHFHMHGVWRNSYEAEEHLKRFGPQDDPVCWSLTGYASGYTSKFFGRELLAIETACMGKGDEHCTWEIKPVEDWGDAARPYLAALEEVDVSAQLFEAKQQYQTQAEQLAILNQMSLELNSATNIGDVFKVAAAKIEQLFNEDRISLALLADDGKQFEVFGVSGAVGALPTGALVPVDGTALGLAIAQNQPLNISNPAQSDFVDTRQVANEHGVESILIAPLFSRGHPIGAVNFGSQQPKAYTDHDERLAMQIASLLAVTIENRHLLDEAQERAAELAENTYFLDSIIENIPTMIFVKEAEELRFVRFNQAGEELLGVDRQELLGKNDYDLFPKEEADTFTAQSRQVLESGQLLDVPEETMETPHGTRTLHTRTVPITDPEGKPRYLLGISEDITERQQAEAALARQATELATVAEVSTAAATLLNPDELLQQVADLTKERFELYHAHIYLLDHASALLNLAAGAGDIGRKMVQQGWSIGLAEEHSLVARTARTRSGTLVNDVQSEPDHLPNPLLPDTRAELAVPMMVGDEVLGVLDVQADTPDYFTEDDIKVHSILAAQVAAALRNATLYEQGQQSLEQTEKLYTASRAITVAANQTEVVSALVAHVPHDNLDRIVAALIKPTLTQEIVAEVAAVWDKHNQEAQFLGNRFTAEQIPLLKTLNSDDLLLIDNVAATAQLDSRSKTVFQHLGVKSVAVLPLSVGQQLLGWLLLETTDTLRNFSMEEIRPYIALNGQAAIALEGHRLLAESQQRARREQILREVTARIRSSADVNSVMRTAAQELGRALGRQTTVTLGSPASGAELPQNGDNAPAAGQGNGNNAHSEQKDA